MRSTENEMKIENIRLAELPSFLPLGNVVIITDSLIHKLYGASFPEAPCIQVPQSEEAKSFENLQTVLAKFASLGVDRGWSVLAIGGGSISDLSGFAAHIWMRGIKCYYVPTTLLSMVDASIGGKNGIDFLGYKNSVGSFQEPECIFCDIAFLHSLPKMQFASGMAEVIKHAVISGEPYFGMLESLGPVDPACLEDTSLLGIVHESQHIKLSIVAGDPLENGQRRVLNLGHTFGHAVESVTGLPHGHSISIGLTLACRLSMARDGLKESEFSRIAALLQNAGLPTGPNDLPAALSPAEVFLKLKMDKKRQDSSVNFAMPLSIGKVVIERLPMDYLGDFLAEALT